jgi:hypothetical protein
MHCGGVMDIEIAPRTEQQLGLYWVAIVPAFADYWDVPPATAHARLKDLANYGRSTTILTRYGWSDFLDRCSELAQRSGITWKEGADDGETAGSSLAESGAVLPGPRGQ